MADYHINVFWSDEDGCYVADIPDLAYCSAFGDTPEKALRQVLVAKEAWLEAARDQGDPIPEPRYRPAHRVTRSPSGPDPPGRGVEARSGPWNVDALPQCGGVQGLYRVRLGSRDLLETFVAAPGPMGWRYFGRAHEPGTDREVFRVDHVVEGDWNLVRFRWSETDGAEVVAIPTGGGVEVWMAEPAGERKELVAGVSAVWSASPSSLLVVDRLLEASKLEEVAAVRLEPPFESQPVTVRVTSVGSRPVATTQGSSPAREVEVAVDGRRTRALLRSDLPLQADGWFELIA